MGFNFMDFDEWCDERPACCKYCEYKRKLEKFEKDCLLDIDPEKYKWAEFVCEKHEETYYGDYEENQEDHLVEVLVKSLIDDIDADDCDDFELASDAYSIYEEEYADAQAEYGDYLYDMMRERELFDD